MDFKRVFFTFNCLLAFAPGVQAISVTPAVVSVTSNTPVFTVSGAGAQGVTWALSSNVGTLSSTIQKATYTPPSSVSQAQQLRLTVTDIANPSLTTSATINLVLRSGITVQPSTATLNGATTQNFSAVLTGQGSSGVNWSVTPAIGTISASGVYTAPAVSVDTNVIIKAASKTNTNVFGVAAVTLKAVNVIKFTTQANGLQTLLVNGVNYNYVYGENLVTSVTSVNSSGQAVRTSPSCTSVFDASSVTKTCANGSAPLTVRVQFNTPDASTIAASVQVTNNSSTDTLNMVQLSLLGIDTPQYDLTKSRAADLDTANPASYVNFISGQWGIWNTAPSPDVKIALHCGWTTFCKNQPEISNIGPNQTKTTGIAVRFSADTKLSTVDFMPEAYAAFRAAYPAVLNWPDRRPIMAWFIADYQKRSATNPRGYLQIPTLDVSNTAAFSAAVMGQAQRILSLMKARPVQPQGLLIWDLEGQEFIQATTYVGDPRVLGQGYAPEMDAVADQVFALFSNAGYKTGITLRPQQLQWGTQLPQTCQYDVDNDFKDYYIKFDNPFGQRFFSCYDPAGANWSLIPQGNGGQTFYPSSQPDKVTALLMSKVAYAHKRWGTTLYYVDTAVSHGGAPLPADTFRQLEQAFPDCLFIPEQSYLPTLGATIPFADPKNGSVPKFAPVTWRYAYPTGGLGIYLANCQGSCWTTNYNDFVLGQRIGDMPIYPQPIQMSPAQLQQIESMILSARSQSSDITVVDSVTGSTYSYHGAASTVYQYPVKMRVYFSDTPANAAASTTYCEAVQWLGESKCNLNLQGLVTAQIRYYDFAGKLVLSNNPGPR